jgi:hypothetical protein
MYSWRIPSYCTALLYRGLGFCKVLLTFYLHAQALNIISNIAHGYSCNRHCFHMFIYLF